MQPFNCLKIAWKSLKSKNNTSSENSKAGKRGVNAGVLMQIFIKSEKSTKNMQKMQLQTWSWIDEIYYGSKVKGKILFLLLIKLKLMEPIKSTPVSLIIQI